MRATREDALYWIKSAVFLTILIGVGLLPPFSGLTQLDMRILGVFISLIFAYSCIGFIWPSLIGAIALGLSGYAPVESVITTGVGSFDVTIFVASLFIFSSYIDDCGLSEYIAHLFISRKIAIGRPYVLATLLFLCAYVLGAFISMFAAMVLLWNIFYKICEMVGYGKKQPYPMLVLIGIVFSASLGYAIFPFKATQVIALNTLAAAGGPEIDVVRFTAVNIVLGVACILGYLALCKFIFRPDVSKLKTKVDYLAQYRGEKLTHESRVGLIFLVAFIAAMFAPSFIDADGTVGALLNNLGAPGALILLLGIMAAVCRKGKTWFDFAKAAGNINWNIIVLFIVIMPLSAALGSDSVNIVPAVVGLLEPLVSNMSTLVFEVAVILFIGGLTIFAPDIILAATLPPILYGFCVRLNVSTELVITLLTFTISAALATPSSSTMSAIIFANTEWIDIKSAYKYCITASILNCLIIIVLGLTVGAAIFGA